MQDILALSLERIKQTRAKRVRTVAVLLVLSFLVSLDVFWVLRQPGLTLAGDADCGIVEHTHDELCQNSDPPCEAIAHVHTIACYSDDTADVETQLDWQNMFAGYPFTGQLRQDLAGIAKTQVGYTESTKNFRLDDQGNRKGYTRYGAWYGAPYNDWSAIFVSFCLHYAGADPDEFPGNIGAGSMAELWDTLDKYAPAGTYDPSPGDLVFFKDNTVGIVSEVQAATIYVIRGDLEDAVKSYMIPVTDSSITGWGITEIPEKQLSPPTETAKPPPEDLLDISNGPVFVIIEGRESIAMQTYSLRSTRAIVDLIPYLESKGGSYFFTLLDHNNVELPKDADGNYIAEANKGYKLTLTFHSPEGFLPGTYQYQIPNGLMVDGGEGNFTLKNGTVVGSWVVTDTGLITLNFNNQITSHTDITISSTLGIHFPEQDGPIDFDGFISVKVEPPAQQVAPTILSKWGTPDAEAGKLNWYVLINGRADSQIPGSILTDQVTLPDWGKPHSYTESDIAAGLNISATGADGLWHTWKVTTDDPHLIWDENGWSYKIPQTATCIYCGELELGSDGWEYMITYTSTPTPLNTPGAFAYENKVTVDGQTAFGWNEFTHGKIEAQIEKEGSFVSDAAGGGFLWEFQATIPGRAEGQRAEYAWFIMDEMKLFDESGSTVRKIYNDVNLATVMATYNGTVIKIPKIQEATDQDMFAWDVAWTSEGVASTRTLNLLCRCQCTPDTCHWGGCEQYWFKYEDGTSTQNGFCQCWTETQNMTFIFVYRTQDMSLVQEYGALGYQLNNIAQLYYMLDGNTSVQVDYDDATVTIPNLFAKQLTADFNGHTAHYRITVNEAKIALTNGTPLYIHDAMTDTLAYISGSLVITTENAEGLKTTLRQGADYTVTYDGSGDQTDAAGKKVHVLDIEILHPQPVMYILEYDTTLIMPEHVSGAIKYTNSASITLWGQEVVDPGVEKVYADINIATKSYSVELYKTCSVTGKALPGATFGLYNAQGGLIASGVTDANGRLMFQTNIVEGIVLREHVLYYLQELRPPPAYQLDSTKHWFCFCDDAKNTCVECNKVLDDVDAFRIPFEEIGIVDIANYPSTVPLPATGGIGTPVYILCGLTIIFGSLVYGFSSRRRYGRRSRD